MTMNIFITNLGRYNEGTLIGEWLELPVTVTELEAVLERIGIDEEYEEYFITDYETDIEGLEIGEYSNIEELNELAAQLEDLEESEQKAIQAMLLDGYDFNEALEKATDGDFRIYYDCDDMTDIAYEVVEESGYLQGVPETVARYFDYEAFGRDLDIEGKYYNIDGDIIEIY